MTSKIRRAIAAAGLSLGLATAAIPASAAEAPIVSGEQDGITTQSVEPMGWGWTSHTTVGYLRWDHGKSYIHAPGNLSVSGEGGGLKMVYQGDGNLVYYVKGKARWQSGTANVPGGRMVLQGDGNVVIYDQWNKVRWAANSHPQFSSEPPLWVHFQEKHGIHVNRHVIIGCMDAARATIDTHASLWIGWHQNWRTASYCNDWSFG